MQITTIFRHRKENLKKCSLQPLVGRSDINFIPYPLKNNLYIPNEAFILSFDGPLLTEEDRDSHLILIDGTWKLADLMEKGLSPHISHLPRRSLLSHVKTAYPRRQTLCADPERGLASVEALYLAYLMMGRSTEGLLDHYHWKEKFLEGIPLKQIHS